MSSLPTVVIIAHECAPYNRKGSVIGSQRPASFARHLPFYNWNCIIICCHKDERRKLDKKDLKTIEPFIDKGLEEFKENNSAIIPLPSLKYDGFADKKWYNLVTHDVGLGTFSRNESKLKKLMRSPYTFIKMFKGDHSQSFQPVAFHAVEYILKKTNINIIIAEHGPDVSVFTAKKLFATYSIPWVTDFRDHSLEMFKKKNLFYVIRSFYKHLLKTCSATINVTPYWAELDAEFYNKKTFCIPNGFERSEFDSQINDTFTKKNSFTITMTGNISKPIDISTFFNVLQLCKNDFPLKFKFIYRGSRNKMISKFATDFNVEDMCDIKEPIPREEVFSLLNTTDVLLLFGMDNQYENNILYKEGYYPGKVFEYFAAGKPILCIGKENDQLGRLIKSSGTGFSTLAPHDGYNFLLTKANEKIKEDRVHYSPDKNVVNNYTRHKLTGDLANILNEFRSKDRIPVAVQ